MTDRVYYHHPEDSQYSLAYVTLDGKQIQAPDDAIIEQYEFDETFFVLYTSRGSSGTVDDLGHGFDDVLDEMSHDDRLITVRYLEIFEEIIEEKHREEGKKLDVYKEIEIGRIPDAIGYVNWGVTPVEVAGQLMSTLILRHTLPNANHRTAIALSEWYLECSDSGFSLTVLATEDFSWEDWVNDYITESKRILTVRRNTTAFSLLQEWGCTIVERKGGETIDLEDYHLDYARQTALSKYAERHTELCTEFMIESVMRVQHDELLHSNGATKAEFVAYLEDAV